MSRYLDEIQYAADQLTKLIWHEHLQLEQIEVQIKVLTGRIEQGREREQFFQLNPELDDDNFSTEARLDTYFGPWKDLVAAHERQEELLRSLDVRAFSRGALSGSLLQYAKQGISLVHGGIRSSPPGPDVKGQALPNLIWQGRNQAMHWEEGKLKKDVKECFTALARNADQKFGQFLSQCLAFEIVELLGWRSVDDFRRDMLRISQGYAKESS